MSWRGQISKKVQEIRMVACQLSESSRGMRQFFHENYNELHMLNPSMPLMYRESELIDPFVYARYGACPINDIYSLMMIPTLLLT